MTGLISVIWIAAFACLLSLVITPLVRNAFVRRGLVDRPDGDRKFHTQAVPRVGGVPIALSYAAAMTLVWALPVDGHAGIEQHLPLILKLLPCAGIIFLTGLLDDLTGLRPVQKLLGLVAGSALAVAAGVRITGLSGHPLNDFLSAGLTVLWLVACSNAFNLIDGLDGLASGMGLFSTLTIFLAALLHGDRALALATLPLAGSLLGFLRYNFNPASVFLGDSGSLLIGFLLGCYGVIWSHKSATMLGMTAPLMALAIPLLDVSLSIVRRWLRGRPIFTGDRHHIHHKLLEKGLTHRGVVIVLYAMCGVYALLSLLQSFSESRLGGLILVLFCSVTWIGVQSLGYFEFNLAGRTLLDGGLRRMVNGQIVLHGLDLGLRAAQGEQACWEALRRSLGEAGFGHVRARLNGKDFETPSPDEAHPSPPPRWQLQVPLPGGDFVYLERSVDTPVQMVIVGPLIELLYRRLAARLAELSPSAATTISLARLATRVDSYEPAPAPSTFADTSRKAGLTPS